MLGGGRSSCQVMLLRNHGAVTCGETVEAAFFRHYQLVKACEIQVRSLVAGVDHRGVEGWAASLAWLTGSIIGLTVRARRAFNCGFW